LPLITVLILAAAAVPPLTGGAPAEEGPPEPGEQPVAVYTPTGADPAARPAARLAAALEAVREEYKRDLAALTARYHAADGHEQRLAVQREIGALKRGVDLKILVVQRDLARDLGDEETAAAIDARLQELATRDVPPPPDAIDGKGGDGRED
jgi:hypothetical protein